MTDLTLAHSAAEQTFLAFGLATGKSPLWL
jgi:hypothetical protein